MCETLYAISPDYAIGCHVLRSYARPNVRQQLSRKRDSLRLARPPVAHDTVIQDTLTAADTIGRMTPADYGTTAHQDRTAQVRIAGREDRSSPCRHWYVDTFPVCAAVETNPKAGKESGEPAPLELPPNGITQ